MKEKNIVFLKEIDKSMGMLVGGKGANLGEMTRQGFPVPSGFCITTEGYREFMGDYHPEDSLTPVEIREKITQLKFPKNLEESLNEALKTFDDKTRFSVRSSATAEDLPYASFAGQQDTYLNISKKDVKEAVINCFASLYSDRAIIYRKENGIKEPSMAVVIQEMVDSESSGVLFTANPVNRNRNQMVIDSIFGLGEAIVSGLVTPDHIVVNKNNNEITQEIEDKEFALLTDTNGQTSRRDLKEKKASLTQEQILELKELGQQIENHYGSPQDIEWALADHKFYILQSRNITTLYPVPKFDDGKYHFLFNMGYQQMNPVAMPVLSLDLLAGATNFHNYELDDYKASFIIPSGQHIFIDFSSLLSIVPKPVQDIYLNKIFPIIDPLAGSAFEELLKKDNDLSKPDWSILKKLFGMLSKFPEYALSKNPEELADRTVKHVEERVHEIEETFNESEISSDKIRQLFKEIYLIDLFLLSFFPLVFSGLFALKRIEGIERKLGKEGKWTSIIQHGNEGNIVTEMNLELGDLADYLVKDRELLEQFSNGSLDIKEYLNTEDSAFAQSFKRFLENYGFRGPGELDISQPRWYEEPEVVLKQIIGLTDNKTVGSHRIEHLEKVIAAKESSIELIETVRESLGPKKAREVSLNLKRFRHYYSLREHLKYYWMKVFGAAKKYLLRIGEALEKNNQIKKRDDIYHLKLEEIANALETGESFVALVTERKNEYNRILKLTPPRVLTSEGEVLMGSIKREDLPEDALAGLGVSPGQITGTAKVVLNPDEAKVEKGEILVAPFTDPGWTPLFVNAEALVTEVGGTLTHGSVVAREYGIPGVVGVVEATKKIKTGDKLLVDGSSGYVRIVE